MSDQNKTLHIAILEYLQRLSRQPGALDGDSIDVATQCLSEAFSLDLYDKSVQAQFLSKQGQTLEDVFEAGLSGNSVASDVGAAAVAGPEQSNKAPKQPTKEDIAESEKLKTQGNACLSAQDFVAALDLYNQAIELNPANHILWANKATCQFKMEQWADAVKSAQKSIAIKNDYSKSHYRLGLAYTQLKKYGDAISALNDAKKIAQANGENNLVGEIDAAIKTAKAQKSGSTATNTNQQSNANPMGGMDFGALASMLGGAGGMGGLEGIMQNPMFAQMAQSMMANMMGGNAAAGGAPGSNPFSGMARAVENDDEQDDDRDYEYYGDYEEQNDQEEEQEEEEGDNQDQSNPMAGIDINDPVLLRVMEEVKTNPMAAMKYINDPVVMAKLGPMMQQMMGGMMGGPGRR